MIILVVTDNVQLFDLIPEMIEQVFPGSEAYGSIRAEDAFSALSSRMRFDQVWSDLDLNSKEFTGIDVLVRAKKESPGAKTVLMSGNFNKADVVKRIGLG
ncbi:MAG TPA: hypothetical protein VK469_23100, partial [Candidatus Kapabacteria bacterium]|nr:hypothetical protein [Candidatus Kapabacteria bacterium]